MSKVIFSSHGGIDYCIYIYIYTSARLVPRNEPSGLIIDTYHLHTYYLHN